MIDPHCHSGSILVTASVADAYAAMADGLKQGEWASSRKRQMGPDLFAGLSVFDGKETFVRIHADPERLTVDYEVGRGAGELRFRNAARVVPGSALGHGEGTAVITLFTWRLASQPDQAWDQIQCVHESEMFRIKAFLERGVT